MYAGSQGLTRSHFAYFYDSTPGSRKKSIFFLRTNAMDGTMGNIGFAQVTWARPQQV